MREHPILFAGEMVRAILEGRKTQTRRVAKGVIAVHSLSGEPLAKLDSAGPRITCPYGQPGDRLWVRESWMDLEGTGIEHRDPVTWKRTRYAYRADSPPGSASDESRKDFGLKWRPSIHMPRSACRLVLEIAGMRVERLQAISEADAVAEGASTPGPFARHHFMDLWTSINGRASWDANPWVWALTFKRLQPTA